MAETRKTLSDNKNRRVSASALSLFSKLTIYSLVAILLISFASLQYYLPYSCRNYYSSKYNYSSISAQQVVDNGKQFVYRIAVVTDLDHDSLHSTKKNTWQSFLRRASLTINRDSSGASVEWDEQTIVLTSQISAGGRAMELSDLAIFDGHLMAVDDRTGIIYRIENFKDIIPWVICFFCSFWKLKKLILEFSERRSRQHNKTFQSRMDDDERRKIVCWRIGQRVDHSGRRFRKPQPDVRQSY